MSICKECLWKGLSPWQPENAVSEYISAFRTALVTSDAYSHDAAVLLPFQYVYFSLTGLLSSAVAQTLIGRESNRPSKNSINLENHKPLVAYDESIQM